jgi:hypothetical protein
MLISCTIVAIFVGVYGFTNVNLMPLPTSKHKPSAVKNQRQKVSLETRAQDDGMVAAIVIMPKSYLPALKRFSQSAMARDIKILRAELEVKDGQMTAVRQLKHSKRPNPKIEQIDKPVEKLPEAISESPLGQERQMVSSGFLYLLAGFQKHRFIR